MRSAHYAVGPTFGKVVLHERLNGRVDVAQWSADGNSAVTVVGRFTLVDAIACACVNESIRVDVPRVGRVFARAIWDLGAGLIFNVHRDVGGDTYGVPADVLKAVLPVVVEVVYGRVPAEVLLDALVHDTDYIDRLQSRPGPAHLPIAGEFWLGRSWPAERPTVS